MKKAVIMGRLTRDPEVIQGKDENSSDIVKYTLAVDCSEKQRSEGKQADYINCVAFKRSAIFAAKYFKKGMRVLVSGEINTGSYLHKTTGIKIPTFEIRIETQEFADAPRPNSTEEFMYMNEDIPIDSSLPFN